MPSMIYKIQCCENCGIISLFKIICQCYTMLTWFWHQQQQYVTTVCLPPFMALQKQQTHFNPWTCSLQGFGANKFHVEMIARQAFPFLPKIGKQKLIMVSASVQTFTQKQPRLWVGSIEKGNQKASEGKKISKQNERNTHKKDLSQPSSSNRYVIRPTQTSEPDTEHMIHEKICQCNVNIEKSLIPENESGSFMVPTQYVVLWYRQMHSL